MMNVPHRGNFALQLVPRILNNWLKRNSHDPSHAVLIELDEEAHIKATSVTSNNVAGLLAVVLRSEATDCILVEGVDEFLDPFFELLFSGREVIRSVTVGLGIGRVFVNGVGGIVCPWVLLAEEKEAPKRGHVEDE